MSTPHAGVRVPATTANLGPGFDAFGAAVSCHLWARSVPHEGEGRVTTIGDPEVGGLPTGDDNLLWRALVRFCEAVGEPVPDVGVWVRTAVPLERGLGSSSAAIVAGLALGRVLTGAAVPERELVELAAETEGHPDNVAPAVLGGLVVTTTAEGSSRPVVRRAVPAPRLRPVALVPEDRQATTGARALLPETLTRGEVATQAGRAGHVLGALLGAWSAAPAAAGDVLHEPPRLEAMPAAGALIRRLRGQGVHAWLSGAGPSVAAAVPRRGDWIAVCREAAGEGIRVLPLEWDLAGLVVCPEGGCAWAAGPACRTCPREMVGWEV